MHLLHCLRSFERLFVFSPMCGHDSQVWGRCSPCISTARAYIVDIRCNEHDPRADTRFATSQWEMALLCNDFSHWLGANLQASPVILFSRAHSHSNTHTWSLCDDHDRVQQSLLPCNTLHWWWPHTVRCRYNAVNFLQNSHNRHYIARPWGWGMGCLLWVWSLTYVLLLSLQCHM